MRLRSVGVKLLSLAALGVAIASASTAPVMAQPDRCRAEAWVFCDPYYARGGPEWQVCVADYIANCPVEDPGSCDPWGFPVGCVANKAPKADLLTKMQAFKVKA